MPRRSKRSSRTASKRRSRGRKRVSRAGSPRRARRYRSSGENELDPTAPRFPQFVDSGGSRKPIRSLSAVLQPSQNKVPYAVKRQFVLEYLQSSGVENDIVKMGYKIPSRITSNQSDDIALVNQYFPNRPPIPLEKINRMSIFPLVLNGVQTFGFLKTDTTLTSESEGNVDVGLINHELGGARDGKSEPKYEVHNIAANKLFQRLPNMLSPPTSLDVDRFDEVAGSR